MIEMKKLPLLLVTCLMVLPLEQAWSAPKERKVAVASNAQGIVAVVNEDIISLDDLGKRLRLIMASAGLPNTPEIKAKLAPQIIGSLVEEQLMMQEAKRLNLTVMPDEIEQGFATIGQQNKMTGDQFKAMLTKGGIDTSTLRRQIEAQVAWGKVVQEKLRPRVVISDMDVEDATARMKAKIGTTEYLAAEIYLPFNDAKQEVAAKGLANRLMQEIHGGKASFFQLAQQFSKSAGSAHGGDVGWLNETQLSEEILAGLKKVKQNQVTEPIRTLTGYHIFFLRNSRTMTEATMPTHEQIYNGLGNERLDRLQRRHLLDLKSSSFVDVRV